MQRRIFFRSASLWQLAVGERPKTCKNKRVEAKRKFDLAAETCEQRKIAVLRIVSKYDIEIVYQPFIRVVGLSLKEFRSQRIEILTSHGRHLHLTHDGRQLLPHPRGGAHHRARNHEIHLPDEAVALYLQKYIVYRKRKISFADGSFTSLVELIIKHQRGEIPARPSANRTAPNCPKRSPNCGFRSIRSSWLAPRPVTPRRKPCRRTNCWRSTRHRTCGLQSPNSARKICGPSPSSAKAPCVPHSMQWNHCTS